LHSSEAFFCLREIGLRHLEVPQRGSGCRGAVAGRLLRFRARVPPACVTEWCSTKRGTGLVRHCSVCFQRCACVWHRYRWCRLCRSGSQRVPWVRRRQEDLEELRCLQRGSGCRHEANSQLKKNPLPVH